MGLVHPEDREFVAETIQKMFAEGRGFGFTKRILRPDGEIRRVRCVGVPATHGGTFHGTGIDVTDQEQLTEELRRSEFFSKPAEVAEIIEKAAGSSPCDKETAQLESSNKTLLANHR